MPRRQRTRLTAGNMIASTDLTGLTYRANAAAARRSTGAERV